MTKRFSTDHFIDEVAQVADAQRRATFSAPGNRLRPQPFDPATQSILLMGLPGSGCSPLASALGERLHMQATPLTLPEDADAPAGREQALSSALSSAMAAMAAPNHVFVLDDRLAPLLDAQALSYLPVTPVYVIATVGLCLERLEKTEQGRLSEDAREALRMRLAARQDALEPVAMTLGRHILRGEDTPALQLRQLLQKLGLAAGWGSEEEDEGMDRGEDGDDLPMPF